MKFSGGYGLGKEFKSGTRRTSLALSVEPWRSALIAANKPLMKAISVRIASKLPNGWASVLISPHSPTAYKLLSSAAGVIVGSHC